MKHACTLFAMGCGLMACQPGAEMGRVEVTRWELYLGADAGWKAVEMPSDVMLELMDAHIIADPFADTTERLVQWVELAEWTYRVQVPSMRALAQAGIEHPVLHLPGLDTYASVFLNDSLILETENAHRHHSVPLPLSTHPSTLRITFHSPVKRGQDQLNELPLLVPVSNEMKPIGEQTSAVTRRPAYQFGWDWAPRLTSCGFTSIPYIEDARQPQKSSARIQTELLEGGGARVIVEHEGAWPQGHWQLHSPDGELLKLEESTHSPTGALEWTIAHPDLWWPNGMGNQPLYRLTWQPLENRFHALNWKVGIREIQWKRQPDAWGFSFECHVNGRRLQARGANVIPADYFIQRARELEPKVIQNAAAAHMNMLRVWGGGVYPSEAFYDVCDEVGLLVWQDFMFACAMVPGSAEFQSNVRSEALEQIQRLQYRPSLALWCGNNETQHAWKAWGWQELYDLHGADSVATEEAYRTIFHDMLPELVREHSTTEYWPSSPMADEQAPNSLVASGDEHAWRVWFDTLDFDYFSAHNGRFASEYGLQSLPDEATLAAVGIDSFEQDALQFRQRSKMEWLQPGLDGWGMMRIYARRYTADPEHRDDHHTALERWVYLTQLTQAIGLREALERHRNSEGKYAGSLYWQLNDVWPTVSWSTVDHSGRWKLAHYAALHANQPNRIMVNRLDSTRLSLTAFHDGPEELAGTNLKVERWNLDGQLIEVWDTDLDLSGNVHLEVIPRFEEFGELDVIRWTWKDAESNALDAGHEVRVKPADVRWPKAHITLGVQENQLILHSDSVAYGVRLSTALPGRFSDNGFMLLPGTENECIIEFMPEIPGTTLNVSDVKVESFAEFQR